MRVTAGDIVLVPGDPVGKIGEHLDTVVSSRDILREAFGYDFDPGTNIVEVHVGHVRRKLVGGRLDIQTVLSLGVPRAS